MERKGGRRWRFSGGDSSRRRRPLNDLIEDTPSGFSCADRGRARLITRGGPCSDESAASQGCSILSWPAREKKKKKE